MAILSKINTGTPAFHEAFKGTFDQYKARLVYWRDTMKYDVEVQGFSAVAEPVSGSYPLTSTVIYASFAIRTVGSEDTSEPKPVQVTNVVTVKQSI